MAQVTFTGEIVFEHPKFVAVREDDGRTQRRWQVWGATGKVGDKVTVTGQLKTAVAKPREEGGEIKFVDHAVNDAQVTATVQETVTGTGGDQWGTGDMDTPF